MTNSWKNKMHKKYWNLKRTDIQNFKVANRVLWLSQCNQRFYFSMSQAYLISLMHSGFTLEI